MKVLSICTLIFFFSCNETSLKDSSIVSEVIIRGKINGSHWRTIHLETRTDITERSREFYFEPDSTETFVFRFRKEIPNDFRLHVGPNTFDGWLYPGDSVYLEATICSDNREFIQKIKFKGKSADQYKYFQRKSLNPLNYKILNINNRARNSDYLTFKSQINKAYLLKLKQFKEDTVGLQLGNEFIAHELNQMKYHYLNKLAKEPILRKYLRFDSIPVPPDYFNFLREVDFQDSSFINSHELYRFLTSAADALNNSGANIPSEIGIPRLDVFLKGRLKFSDSLLSGTVKEIFESKIIDNYAEYDLDKFDSLRVSLDTKGHDNAILKYYKNLSDSLRALEFRIGENVSVYTENGDTVDLLAQIKKHKYTYLNIWFIGCRGCAMDFKNQGYFVEKYGNEVQFLNICTSKPGKRFDDYIASYRETGTHLFDLNENLTKQITAYPYHGLFNRNGELLINNVLRPSDPKLNQLLDSLVNFDN